MIRKYLHYISMISMKAMIQFSHFTKEHMPNLSMPLPAHASNGLSVKHQHVAIPWNRPSQDY